MKKLTIIGCIDANGLIGFDNKLPWNHPEEMAHFKTYTKGKTVIMGSNTFYSLKSPLEGRVNVVISSNDDRFETHMTSLAEEFAASGKELPMVCFANSLEEFLQADLTDFGDEMVCIGGALMYASLMPYATDLVITRLNNKYIVPTGEESKAVYFPAVDADSWTLIETKELKTSLDTDLGVIMYLKANFTYENVVSFKTRRPLEVEEYFCAVNMIGSAFDVPSTIIEEVY